MRIRTTRFTSAVVNYCNSYDLSLCLQLSSKISYTFSTENMCKIKEAFKTNWASLWDFRFTTNFSDAFCWPRSPASPRVWKWSLWCAAFVLPTFMFKAALCATEMAVIWLTSAADIMYLSLPSLLEAPTSMEGAALSGWNVSVTRMGCIRPSFSSAFLVFRQHCWQQKAASSLTELLQSKQKCWHVLVAFQGCLNSHLSYIWTWFPSLVQRQIKVEVCCYDVAETPHHFQC